MTSIFKTIGRTLLNASALAGKKEQNVGLAKGVKMSTQFVESANLGAAQALVPERGASVQEKLQRQTHGFHTRLSHHPLLQGLTRPGYSILAYTRLLLAYQRFYRPLDWGIEAALRRFKLPYRYENRLPWLEEDLRHFQIEAVATGQRAASLPWLADIDRPGKVIGILYAIEGSALGGQVILRHLADNLGLTGENGARFFQGHGSDTRLRWQEFCAFAESIAEQPDELQQAEQAASHVFQMIETLLDNDDDPCDHAPHPH